MICFIDMLKTVKQKMGLNISDLEAFSQIKTRHCS